MEIIKTSQPVQYAHIVVFFCFIQSICTWNRLDSMVNLHNIHIEIAPVGNNRIGYSQVIIHCRNIADRLVKKRGARSYKCSPSEFPHFEKYLLTLTKTIM